MRTVKVVSGTYPRLAGRFSDSPIELPSDADYALGAISKPDGSPAILYVFDPDPKFIRAGLGGNTNSAAWRDSASGKKWSTNANKSLIAGTGINGKPTLTLAADTQVNMVDASGLISATSFSLFFVFSAVANAGNQTIIGPVVATDPANGGPLINISTEGYIKVYVGSSDTQLVSSHDWVGEPVLLGVTFSTTKGVTIRRNGVEVVADATRTMQIPENSRNISLFAARNFVNLLAGTVGKMIIADVDMSLPEYSYGKSTIEDHLLSFYGITHG